MYVDCVMDQLVLPRPYQGSYRGCTKRGGWLTLKSEVRLGGMEGANRLSPMGGKGHDSSRGGAGF